MNEPNHAPSHEELTAVQRNATLLYTPAQVQAALDAMAAQITARLAGHRPLLLCVLTGGAMTTTWLAQRLDFDLQIDYVRLARYHGHTRAHDELSWLSEPGTMTGRHVVLVDDIYDEGVTLSQLTHYCHQHGAVSVTCAVLLRKKHTRNRGAMVPDIIGLEVEDQFIFGCGLDYKHYLRNRTAIYAVNEGTDTL